MPLKRKHSFVDSNGVELVGKQRTKEYLRWYLMKNAERIKKQKADAYQIRKNIPGYKEKEKAYRDANKDRHRAYCAQRYLKKKEQLAALGLKRDHKKQIEYSRKRYATTVSYKLRRRMSSNTNRAVKRGWSRDCATSRLIGCKWDELKAHIERQFLPGMSWENHGLRGWHIDHIRPLASFDLTDSEQCYAALHYTNLQPLWAKDNLKKSDKLFVG